MSYNKDFYKKIVAFINSLKSAKTNDELSTCFETCFHKITKEKELNDKGTSLIKLIQGGKIVKKMDIKLQNDNLVILNFITVEQFECGLGLVYELFEKDRQTGFYIYDLSNANGLL